MQTVDENHPQQVLLFFSTSPLGSEQALGLQQALEVLSATRRWTLDPPVYVDDDSSDVRTTGVLLKLYSALPPRGERLPREVDRSQLEEIKAVIEMLKEITVREAVEFEGELDEVYVGTISRGRIDNVMAEGLIRAWERNLYPS